MPNRYFSALRRPLVSVQELVKQNLRNAQSTQKAYHDRVIAEQFSIGNLVLVYNPVTYGCPKFQKHWEEQYLNVSKLAGGVTYILRSTINAKFVTVHRERLKLCLAEPLKEQCVQHVEAERVAPNVLQPPQPQQVLQPPINQLAPSLVQLILPPQPNPFVPAVQAAQPLPRPPVQVPGRSTQTPLK